MAPQTTSTIPTDDPMVVIRSRGSVKVMHIDVPLAGFRADDVIVRPEECRLLILNSKRGGNEENDDTIIRSVPLPESVDPYTVEAEMHDGILTVDAPMKY